MDKILDILNNPIPLHYDWFNGKFVPICQCCLKSDDCPPQGKHNPFATCIEPIFFDFGRVDRFAFLRGMD